MEIILNLVLGDVYVNGCIILKLILKRVSEYELILLIWTLVSETTGKILIN